jgi:hypothetical protein
MMKQTTTASTETTTTTITTTSSIHSAHKQAKRQTNLLQTEQSFMVDLCRPSTLSANNSIISPNSNDNTNNGNSNFFPSLFVRIDS